MAVETDVDSDLARRYLARSDHEDSKLGDRLSDVEQTYASRVLDRAALQRLAEDTSPDFATLYFVTRVNAVPENRAAFDLYQRRLAALRGGSGTGSASGELLSYELLFVPGWLYNEDRTTGADLARQRALFSSLGATARLIPVDENGSIEANAQVVASEVLAAGKRGKKVVLVSASKGGPETALALGKLLSEAQQAHVMAWVSLGGVLHGSPVADEFVSWPKCHLAEIGLFFMGHDTRALTSMTTTAGDARFAALHFAPHLLMLQFIGAPLSGQVTDRARSRYEELRSRGPNDGLTFLADELVPGAIAIAELGLDHYYSDPEIDLKSLALAEVVLDAVAHRTQRAEVLSSTGSP